MTPPANNFLLLKKKKPGEPACTPGAQHGVGEERRKQERTQKDTMKTVRGCSPAVQETLSTFLLHTFTPPPHTHTHANTAFLLNIWFQVQSNTSFISYSELGHTSVSFYFSRLVFLWSRFSQDLPRTTCRPQTHGCMPPPLKCWVMG